MDKEEKIFPGIDYCNAYIKDFPVLNEANDKTNMNRKNEPRMPWHDVGILVVGEAARDLSFHFH